MSSSPKGILAYGYDLGGEDSGWKFYLSTDESVSIDIKKAEQILLTQIVGFTETWETRKDNEFHDRLKIAKEKLGISFVYYCSYDYPSYVLATQVFEANDWGSKPIKPYLDHSAFDRLERALNILGIVPNQAEPSWILASFYG